MGFKKEKYIIKLIDKKLDNFIINFSRDNNIGNYRKASKELVEWVQNLQEEIIKQKRKGRY